MTTRNAVARQNDVVVAAATDGGDILLYDEPATEIRLLRRVDDDQTLLARVPDLEFIKCGDPCFDVVLCIHFAQGRW